MYVSGEYEKYAFREKVPQALRKNGVIRPSFKYGEFEGVRRAGNFTGRGTRKRNFTMSYNELIKNFERIRDYMRDFYVYGFRTRKEFRRKSARSYDDERRRIESWLSDYMSFRNDGSGKSIFLSVDGRTVPHNPLYKAFRAKSFTDLDITLHFYILDILAEGERLSFREITEKIFREYLSETESDLAPDESTIRNKLKEYAGCGLLRSERRGREMFYFRSDGGLGRSGGAGSCCGSKRDSCCGSKAGSGFSHESNSYCGSGALGLQSGPQANTEAWEKSWEEAAAFYSEAAPLGVIGSYLLDRYENPPAYFSFKHHYLLNAFDSEILGAIVECRRQKCKMEITVLTKGQEGLRTDLVFPLKVYVGTQNGRLHLMAYYYRAGRPWTYRLDHIKQVRRMEREEKGELYDSYGERFWAALWGTSSGSGRTRELEHVEMTVHMDEGEEFVRWRLEREKRCGRVEILDKHTCKYVADVYDAQELVPWLRTFIGRIEKFSCSNDRVRRGFYRDLEEMAAMYGGEGECGGDGDDFS